MLVTLFLSPWHRLFSHFLILSLLQFIELNRFVDNYVQDPAAKAAALSAAASSDTAPVAQEVDARNLVEMQTVRAQQFCFTSISSFFTLIWSVFGLHFVRFRPDLVHICSITPLVRDGHLLDISSSGGALRTSRCRLLPWLPMALRLPSAWGTMRRLLHCQVRHMDTLARTSHFALVEAP